MVIFIPLLSFKQQDMNIAITWNYVLKAAMGDLCVFCGHRTVILQTTSNIWYNQRTISWSLRGSIQINSGGFWCNSVHSQVREVDLHSGYLTSLTFPADRNHHHGNLDWRLELLCICAVYICLKHFQFFRPPYWHANPSGHCNVETTSKWRCKLVLYDNWTDIDTSSLFQCQFSAFLQCCFKVYVLEDHLLT